MVNLAIAFAVEIAALSVVSFATYGFDKRRARQSRDRVPEKTLHVMALLGGWPGAYLGQQSFRHKTQKLGFRVVFWLCVFAHVAAVASAFVLLRKYG